MELPGYPLWNYDYETGGMLQKPKKKNRNRLWPATEQLNSYRENGKRNAGEIIGKPGVCEIFSGKKLFFYQDYLKHVSAALKATIQE